MSANGSGALPSTRSSANHLTVASIPSQWMSGRMSSAYRTLVLVALGLPLSWTAAPVALAAPAKPAPVITSGQGVGASPSPTPTARVGGTSALVIDGAGAQTLLGLPVQTSKGEGLGRVVDVVVDRNGALLAAIIDFGGFLGVGSRKIAVDWRILHFPKSGDLNKLVADLPSDRLRAAPAFKPGEPIVIMGAPAAPSRAPPTPAATKP